MIDFQKLPKVQSDVIRKAFRHMTEARDLLCCANSPFGSVRDQDKVQALFTDFVSKLKNLK